MDTRDETVVVEVLERFGVSTGEDSLPTLATALISALRTHDVAQTMPGETAPSAAVADPPPSAGYEDLGLLGEGGFGVVRRVHDVGLDRTLAMKILRPERASFDASFRTEARVTGRLQHPGVIPVHELGRLADGRTYFTMPEVHGRTLRELLRAVHDVSSGERWGTTDDGWGLERLVEVFQKACDAVAYAHSHGIVHRDLKPANVMIGAFGQVLVIDWGLARERGVADATAVEGTPAYMSPEQAVGGPLDERTDVYCLGAVLYEILAGVHPYDGLGAKQIWAKLCRGLPPEPLGPVVDDLYGGPVAPGAGPPLPTGLVAICERAMEPEAEDRYADASMLADALQSWRSGAERRARARALVAEAQTSAPREASLRERASQLRREAREREGEVPRWAPEEEKLPLWELEDEAARLERDIALEEARREQLLHAALLADPRLAEAHAALATLYAELLGRTDGAESAALLEARLRRHLAALPAQHPLRDALDPDGRPTRVVVALPDEARASLYRYELERRRLVAREVRALPPGPVDVELAPGSWRVDVTRPEREPQVLPIVAGRAASVELTPSWLPAGALQRSCLVPAGPCIIGGDPEADDCLPRREVHVDAFVIGRFAVTNAEYVAFLDDLVDRGRTDEALHHAPRERPGQPGEQGALVLRRDADGHFLLGADADGDVWEPDAPIVLVDWFGARAYCAWRAERDGLPWRLPWEVEWEKAARGVDGRAFPWGNHHDPSWSCMRDSFPRHRLVGVDTFPVDESPYGVRGLGGLVRDWCEDAYDRDGPDLSDGRARCSTSDDPAARRVEKGGAWYGFAKDARAANRFGAAPTARFHNAGFRICRSV